MLRCGLPELFRWLGFEEPLDQEADPGQGIDHGSQRAAVETDFADSPLILQ